ncbi:Putative FAD dependent oxidoreductase, FAD/NAD(P)-binding domain superfamily, MTOX family [Septoria linicola]|uniref:FAD dependent oxidoreductase, FAD/NAD(P)-binding domain superfamily, MTOX family n=1 Tax=Septoria linicola TaxID=215465 RepID=A0A9Q9AZ25_9PEZI|nr:Putative FAD dependent oxidoreductase, FAD/NAD(P)-binding domain superfamily, MTOX family [Septoria linicola]
MERVHQIASHFASGQTAPQATAPKDVLIVGSGVFGLGTAYALAQREKFKNTKITVLERTIFPAQDGASIDNSRIIRADYEDLVYAKLMEEAMPYWKGEFGEDGRFSQSGLALISNGKGESAETFMRGALKNVTENLGLKVGKDVTIFDNEADARKVMGTNGGFVGDRGYVNWTSGWAHAENGVKFMRKKVEALNRVHFQTSEVQRLLFKGSNEVLGVELTDGTHLTADLTILATGAWTPKLIDTRGICSATGQVLTYIDITPEEQAKLSQPGQPVILCENDGLFIIPPTEHKLKIARHGYGYANFVTIPHPEIPNEKITVSLPKTKLDDPNMDIPAEGKAVCRAFLRAAVPSLGDRPFTYTRICWYTDTPSGDWLITYHPKYKGLFVATGGSGHGYKFLPIIGERIVDVIQARDRDELGRELRGRWKWPEQRQKEDHVWTNDWRGEG